jgi:uncharacterized protein YggE
MTMEWVSRWRWTAIAALAGLAAAGGGVAQSATGPGPTLTVVGYGVVNTTMVETATPPELQVNLQESGTNPTLVLRAIYQDIAQVKAQLEKAGASASAVSVQNPPNLNAQQGGTFSANVGVTVAFPTLARLAHVLTASNIANDSAVQNVWINQASTTPVASPAAVASGYAAALNNAAASAAAIAAADHLHLGAQVSVSEGTLSPSCNAMGGCGPAPMDVIMPTVGPNQELVAVTVTYDTNP